MKLNLQLFADGKVVIKTDLDDSGFKNGLNKMQSIAKKGFGAMTTAVTAVTAAITATAGAVIKLGSDFEAQMSKVQAISGSTAEEMEKLNEKAKEMGATTKFTATESAQAFEYMAMAGWKTEDMLDGIEGVLDLAAASGSDLGTTSDIVTDALTAMGLTAKDTGRFVDILASASANSNTNVELMGETFKYAASLAGSLGYSAEDTAIAIGLMANAGIKGSQAGTSLRSIMSRLATDTGGARTQLEEMGIEVINQDGSMRDFGDVISDLRNKFGNLNESEKAQVAQIVAGKNAISGFLAIVNSSDQDFNKLTEAINNSNGAAKNMADTMMDNLKGQLTLFSSAAQGLGLELYQSIDNPLKNMVKSANGYIKQLSDAFKRGGFKDLIKELGPIFSDVVTKISESMPQIIELSISVIESFVDGIQQNLPAIAEAAVEIMLQINNTLISMLPQLLEMGIQLLLELTKGIVKALPELVPVITRVVLDIVDILLDHIDEIIEMGIQILVALTEGIMNALPELIARLPEIIIKIVSKLIELSPQLVSAAIRIMAELGLGLIRAIPDLLSRIPQILSSMVGAFMNGVGEFFNIGVNLIKGLWNGIKNTWESLKSTVSNFAGGIVDFFKGVFGIHSPSKVFADEIGAQLSAGLGVGFEDGLDDVYRDMQRAIDFETSKLTANVESSGTYQMAMAGLPTFNLQDNSESTHQLVVDGKVLAEVVNTENRNREVARA